MATYSSFEEAFDDVFKTTQEWLEEFGRMTFEEFNNFFYYVYENRLDSIINNQRNIAKPQLERRLPLLVALCAKVLEAANFCDDMDQDWRDSAEAIANTWFEFLVSLFGDMKRGSGMKAAWDAQRDYCLRFGYRSGPVFDVLAPHRVFS